MHSRKTLNYIITKITNDLHQEYPENFKEKYHPHSFRRSKATHLYHSGISIIEIKEFLGHDVLKSTEIYTKMDNEKYRKQILDNAITIPVTKKYKKREKENLDQWLKNNIKF